MGTNVVFLLSLICPLCCSSSLVDFSSCLDPHCPVAAQSDSSTSSRNCLITGDSRWNIAVDRQAYHYQLMAAGSTGEGMALNRLTKTQLLSSFAVDYGHDVLHHNHDDQEIAITFDERGGARWRTHVQFESGFFTVKIKTPEGNTSGLNTSFYLSSLEGDKSQDEIDFEFLGKDKSIMQTNYYSGGIGSHEEIHQLGFDSSKDFHEYSVHWLPQQIDWLIDGKVIRTVEKKDGKAFPEKPMFLYASMWNAGDIDEGRWAGPYVGSDAPYVCKYRDITVPLHDSDVKGP